MLSTFAFGQVWVPYTDVNIVAVCGVHSRIPVAPFSSMNETQPWVYGDRGGFCWALSLEFQENCYQENLSNLPSCPCLHFLICEVRKVLGLRPSLNVKYSMSEGGSELQEDQKEANSGLLRLSCCLIHCSSVFLF